MEKISELVNHLSKGSISTLARLISMLENEQPGAVEALGNLYLKNRG